MALQAKHVDVAELQQMRVGRTVRDMAGGAAFDFHGGVFEYEGAVLVDVALEADGVLRGRHADLLGQLRAVGIVAIGALHQAFVHAMAERHRELRLLLEVAGVAKLRLSLDQQELLRLCVVRGMAGNAAHFILMMKRVRGLHVLG